MGRKSLIVVAALITGLLGLFAVGAFFMQSLKPVSRMLVMPEIRFGSEPALVPAPAALTSPLLRTELAEINALQAKRTPQINERIAQWQNTPVQRWNDIARNLVARNSIGPTRASRIYALLSVAQYDALQTVEHHREFFGPVRPDGAPSGAFDYPSSHAAIAAASALVLSDLFPAESASLIQQAKEHQELMLYAGVNVRSDLTAGEMIGRLVAQQVNEYAHRDRSDERFSGVLPIGEGIWRSQLVALQSAMPITSSTAPSTPMVVSENALGITPHWGKVRPWLMTSGAQFRLPPPPPVGSAEYVAALAELRRLSDTRTPEELRVAQFWADGPSTATPPGHWNKIAIDLIGEAKITSTLHVAQIMATLNVAMMDAGIACWDSKYTYWYFRPSQADPSITTPIGSPNFPAYPSGHACFSGAASEVLAHYLPARADDLRSAAKEAATSRLYGGIHWRFDSTTGLALGQKIAALAIKRLG
ncbi:MAG: phosphatase PAP2 family protein [Anaerolineae bacterium]|nr:phosphatase PAP2 family protein [Anaerolineae bacterium]